jgi:hypothetical protein
LIHNHVRTRMRPLVKFASATRRRSGNWCFSRSTRYLLSASFWGWSQKTPFMYISPWISASVGGHKLWISTYVAIRTHVEHCTYIYSSIRYSNLTIPFL